MTCSAFLLLVFVRIALLRRTLLFIGALLLSLIAPPEVVVGQDSDCLDDGENGRFLDSIIPAAKIDIDVESFTLSNGMQVVVIPDHRAPVVTHMVSYMVGAADEPQGKGGIAHFLEHLMFKGTPRYPGGEFSSIVQRNGGEDNAFTDQDYTSYFQLVPKDRLPIVMDLESDRMANLMLNDRDVIPELEVVQEERRSSTDNDPAAVLDEQMDAALFTAHPYGKPVIGWMTEVVKLRRDDALAFYRAHYTPRNAILVVAGDITAGEVQALAEKYYGTLRNTAEPPKRVRTPEPEPIAARRVVMSDLRMGIDLVKRSYLTPSYGTDEKDEAVALEVLADILGGSISSRLSRKLVIDGKLAQEVTAFYSGDKRDSGKLVVYAAASPGSDLVRIEKAVDAVIADVVLNGITAPELDRAKRRLLAEVIYTLDGQSCLAQLFGTALTTDNTIEDITGWQEKLDRVTAEEVKEVAGKFMKLERSVTGVITRTVKASEH